MKLGPAVAVGQDQPPPSPQSDPLQRLGEAAVGVDAASHLLSTDQIDEGIAQQVFLDDRRHAELLGHRYGADQCLLRGDSGIGAGDEEVEPPRERLALHHPHGNDIDVGLGVVLVGARVDRIRLEECHSLGSLTPHVGHDAEVPRCNVGRARMPVELCLDPVLSRVRRLGGQRLAFVRRVLAVELGALVQATGGRPGGGIDHPGLHPDPVARPHLRDVGNLDPTFVDPEPKLWLVAVAGASTQSEGLTQDG